MKLSTIQEILINEILDFNNIESYKYNVGNKHFYKFIDDDNDVINVKFTTITLYSDILEIPAFLHKFNNLEVINVGFDFKGIDSKWKTIPLSKFLKILKTINDITHEYITKNNPDGLVIFATDRYGGLKSDPTKAKIYNIMVKQSNIDGYGFANINFGKDGILIYNKKFIKK